MKKDKNKEQEQEVIARQVWANIYQMSLKENNKTINDIVRIMLDRDNMEDIDIRRYLNMVAINKSIPSSKQLGRLKKQLPYVNLNLLFNDEVIISEDELKDDNILIFNLFNRHKQSDINNDDLINKILNLKKY